MRSDDPNSLFCPEKVSKAMSETLNGFCLPTWLVVRKDGQTRECPKCGKPLTLSSIRSINLCLNPQHLGDIQLEILCHSCHMCYYWHFRKACQSTPDFVDSISAVKIPENDPVLMEDITPDKNNIADIIIENDRKEKSCPS